MPNASEMLNPASIFAHAHLAKGMRVAELCCGSSGHFVFPLSKMVGEDGMIYAVDILKSALNGIEGRAKLEGAANITTVWSDLEKYGATKIDSESLDCVSFINDQPKPLMLKEGARLLKSGGTLLIVDWTMKQAPLGPPPEKRVGAEVYKEAVPPLGFSLKEQFIAGQYHYGLVFQKA
jgi:ubiquinone/menaquinone biosynthesis C-methylase UbiE